jgi:hypothetical protein
LGVGNGAVNPAGSKFARAFSTSVRAIVAQDAHGSIARLCCKAGPNSVNQRQVPGHALWPTPAAPEETLAYFLPVVPAVVRQWFERERWH